MKDLTENTLYRINEIYTGFRMEEDTVLDLLRLAGLVSDMKNNSDVSDA